jgi:hypothetical protein
VREDLKPGAMLAQSCHVAFTFGKQFPDISNIWQNESNYLVILSVKNEYELNKLIEKAILKNIKFSIFREPDINNQVTAIALEPGIHTKKLCSRLKLALN